MAHFGEFLTKGGALEIIRRLRGLKVPLERAQATLKTLVEAVAKMAKRLAVNTLAIRVLDIEVIERDAAIWKRIREIEEAGLGGSLDDYEKKSDAEEAHNQLEEKITELKQEVAALDEKYVQIVDHMTEEEVRAMFENN